MAFDPDAIAADAGRRLSSINETMLRVKYDPPPVSLRSFVVFALAVILIAAGSVWYLLAANNAAWRERIAASSAVVDALVAKGATVATATDEQIAEGLKDANEKLEHAERALRVVSAVKPVAARDMCTVPASCLRE